MHERESTLIKKIRNLNSCTDKVALVEASSNGDTLIRSFKNLRDFRPNPHRRPQEIYHGSGCPTMDV